MAAPIPDPTPQGAVPAVGIPTSQDYARLIYAAPYFDTVAIAEIIEPSVTEAVEAVLPALVPPYVDQAAQTAVQQSAVLLTGSTMSGPLNLSPLMPTANSMAATKAYVDTMISTAGVPEVPAVPAGQTWARQTGQWVPLTTQTGVFLPLTGGTMTGPISMGGFGVNNLAAIPNFPNGAAPAQWVLNQIASVSLYQGTWNLDTYTPDLTLSQYHINGYTWIAITTNPSGIVIGPAVPGLQGKTVYNGDQVIYSTAQGGYTAIHAGGLTLSQADARYVQLAGGTMTGNLLLNANATLAMQAVPYQQLQSALASAGIGEAPADGQLYGRNGLTHAWAAVLPLAGGILTGALTLAGNASANLNPVPLQQMTSSINTAVSAYLPLAGGAAMTGLFTLSGNAGSNLNPVPLQQLNGMLGSYLPLSGGTIAPGPLVINGNAAAPQAIPFPVSLDVVGADTVSPVVFVDGYGAGGTPNLIGRRAGGTAAAPTALQSGDSILTMQVFGRGATGYATGAGRASLSLQTTENWSDTAQGTGISFIATAQGSIAPRQVASFRADAGCQLLGTQINDNAQAGWVGEYLSSIVASPGVSLTSGTPANIATLNLSPGDWDVWCEFWTNPAGATTTVLVTAGVSTVSATLPSGPQDSGTRAMFNMAGLAGGASFIVPVAPCRISVVATQIAYLIADCFFSGGTLTGFGKICARRRR